MKSNKKNIIAWFLLTILLIMLFILNYIKFFNFYNYKNAIEVEETEDTTTEAINIALMEIVNNFNSSEEIEKYKEQGINIIAKLNNYSIFIYYQQAKTITYEFKYNKLTLNININNNETNLNDFNLIYKILLKSIQKRIKNDIEIDNVINSHINENIELVGIEKNINNNIITYKIDITKKIKIKEGE